MIEYFTDILTQAFNGGEMEQMSLHITIVFIIFFALIGFWVLRSNIEQINLFPKKRDLKNHDLFTNYSRLKNVINTFTTSDNELTDIFRIVVTHKLEVVYSQTLTFVKSNRIKGFQRKELEACIFELLKTEVTEYNRLILNSLQSKYGKIKGELVYEYVMNAPGIGFNHWHSVNVKHIERMVASIMNSTVIKGNVYKMEIILYEILFGLHAGIIDAEKAFYAFNGSLQNILKEPNDKPIR